MSRKVRSILALLLLTLFLGTGAAHALPAGGPARETGMLDAIWDWVTSLLGVDVPFLPAHEASEVTGPEDPSQPNGQGRDDDGGGYIDPNGGS